MEGSATRDSVSLFSLLVGVSLTALPGATPLASRHDFHVSHARVVVEGNVVLARVRFFKDDLEKALKRPMVDDSISHAALTSYVNKTFVVRADGALLTGEFLDGAPDKDGDQAVWWILIQYKAAKPVSALGLRDHVLFETFSDQQNLVALAKQPGDQRKSLYFQAGDRTEQVVRF